MEDAFVEVIGFGSATTPPDRVRIHVAAVAEASRVGDAFAAADTASKAMLTSARHHGVADEDLRSSHVEVQSSHRGSGTEPRFHASMGIEVTVRDVAASGRVLAAVVEAGGDASRVQRVSLAATAPLDALAEARAAAWADALDRARQYARLSGRDLGAVLQVSEAPQVPSYADASGVPASFSSVSVEPGSQPVAAAITVRWALQ